MTNLEKATKATLLQFMLDAVGATELNSIKQVRDHAFYLEIEMEDGAKKTLSITVIDSDE